MKRLDRKMPKIFERKIPTKCHKMKINQSTERANGKEKWKGNETKAIVNASKIMAKQCSNEISSQTNEKRV